MNSVKLQDIKKINIQKSVAMKHLKLYKMCPIHRDSMVAQRVKSLPAMWETRVRSLGREDPLEKEIQCTPVFLPGQSRAWRSRGDYSPWGHKE